MAGCNATKMAVSTTQTVNKPTDGKAKVVFMRDSFMGSAISAFLFNVTSSDDVKLIGIINNDRRVAYEVSDRAVSKFNHLNGEGSKMKTATKLVEISPAAK